MLSTVFQIRVRLPSASEFAEKYPPYGPFVCGRGKFLFELLMTPENFLRARFASEMGAPAVSGVAAICEEAAKKQGFDLKDDKFAKQSVGAMICVLMEANDWEKTGERRAIPHRAFSKGTVYQPQEKTP